MTIDLTPEQIGLIRELIEHRIAELGPEIHHTSTAPYRDELKHQRDVLRNVQGRFEVPDEKPVVL